MQIIIVGCGKVGRTLAEQLQEEDTDITLIDINPDRINEITDEVDAMGVVGNGASINTLMEAGIETADILIAGDDTGSLKGSEDLVYKSQEWLSKQYVADADNWGVIDETRWNNFYKWLAENNLTTKDLTGKGFSNDYLPK